MDLVSVLGFFLGTMAVVGGVFLEGGNLGSLFQLTAIVVVFGGTAGATFLSFPASDIWRAIALLPQTFSSVEFNPRSLIEEMSQTAAVVRKDGVLALDSYKNQIANSGFKRGVQYIMDGYETESIRDIFDTEIKQAREADESAADVFESAGGYAPVLGMIGTIGGLVALFAREMSDPMVLINGISVALVTALYGLVLGNVLLTPWSSKIRRQSRLKLIEKELVKVGVIGMQEGLSPKILKEKLELYIDEEE